MSVNPDGDLESLNRALGTPETAWLVARTRARLESTGQVGGFVTKTVSSGAERTAAAKLLGQPVRAGTSVSVSLDALDRALRRSGIWPGGLASAIVALTGNVANPAVRSAEQSAWRQANHDLRVLAEGRGVLRPWVDTVVRTGALKGAVSEPGEVLSLTDALVAIADALPAGSESLSDFALRVTGDARALDRFMPLGTLAAGLAAQLGGSTSEATPGSARWHRDSWTCVGVEVDDLSSTVITLGLPGGSSTPTARVLATMAAADQPVVLTLRQLSDHAVGHIPTEVFVCENPSLVSAAADLRGARGAALVCLSGSSSGAGVMLLQGLARGGAALRYHGDFDWEGIGIATNLARHVAWEPWRFASADYESACERAGAESAAPLPLLRGAVLPTPWDPALSDTMASARRKVDDEFNIDQLLNDLAGLR